METYSPAEELFNRRRRMVGLFVGPAIFLTLLMSFPSRSNPRLIAWRRSWR